MIKSVSRLRVGGAITALVTPFRDGALDTIGLMAHVEWQLLSGVDGLLACSLTGEGPVLTELERARKAWRKRFGAQPASASERAKQIRFLLGRGFSLEVIRRVVRDTDGDL